MNAPDDSDPRDAALGDLLRRAAQDEAPPAAARARALALGTPGIAQRAARTLRRIVAAAWPPAGEPLPFAPAFGVRGGGTGGGQWLFRAEDCEIDLRAGRSDDENWRIAGQLFGALAVHRVVLEGGADSHSAALGPTREFDFTGLPPGRYRLVLQGDELEVVVPQIDLGSVR